MTRRAADVGAGLAAARDARPIAPGERIHVIGAAGAGASAAALHAAWAGAFVTACDAGGSSPYTASLERAGVPVELGHAAAHVTQRPRPSRVAVTKALTAVDPDHPELVAAREAGTAIEPWQQLIADAASGRRLVAVAGTHGKSTTAGLLTHLLAAAGRDPAAFVGALMPAADLAGNATDGTPAVPSTGRRGAGPEFVVEADEYAGNFDPYRPSLAVLTTVDWDHPDVFADAAAVSGAFEAWIRRMPADGTLVAYAGDPGVDELLTRLGDWPGTLVTAALVDTAPQRVASYLRGMRDRYATARGPARVVVGRVGEAGRDGLVLEVHGLTEPAGPLVARLGLSGRHNAANALVALAAASVLGVAPASLAAGAATFTGIGRRLERLGETAGVVVYDDYGHHPTAIRATIAALREHEPGRRLWAVHEPLTFHRTAALLDALAAALADADAVAIADIWPGRDPDTTITSSGALAAAVRRLRPDLEVEAPGSVEDTAAALASRVRAGDAVLVMGGGRSYAIGRLLLDALGARSAG